MDEYFIYETKIEHNTNLELYNVFLKNVEFKILYETEYEYFLSPFYEFMIDKVVITNKIIEFYIDETRKGIISDWYYMESMFPFLYEIENDDSSVLTLTRIHYATHDHLLQSLIDFPYYSIQEKPYTDCICFKNSLCSEDRHYKTCKSTQGFETGYCTFYTLYECTFKNVHYNKLYICSDCSLLLLGNNLYSLYVNDVPPSVNNTIYDCLQDKICPDVLDTVLDYIISVPKYKPIALYEHVFDGNEPGYNSNCGILDLESISYKMGVKIMCNLQYNLHGKKQIFDYMFNYKTSTVEIESLKHTGKYKFKLYLYLGYFLKHHV